METSVLIALGSNRRHGRYGAPADVLRAAVAALAKVGIRPQRLSRIHATAPVGPSDRRFANAVLLATTTLDPPALLQQLKSVEQAFGRRRGRPWGARVLDLDLIDWDGKVWPDRLRWHTACRGLLVPHRAMHLRRFVLDPLLDVAPGWRHPVLGLTARQLHARLRQPKIAR